MDAVRAYFLKEIIEFLNPFFEVVFSLVAGD